MTTTVSPFARSSAFDEWTVSAGRDMSVSSGVYLYMCGGVRPYFLCQVEEMYSVPESFLEIEVKNPQTHGEHRLAFTLGCLPFMSVCSNFGDEY